MGAVGSYHPMRNDRYRRNVAHYSADGATVTLVTCTLGEEGEILVPELAQLAADQADQLGGVRIGELADAMRALGVTDHRFLGGAGRFRDSGMIGTPGNDNPRAFWRADKDDEVFTAAVTEAVKVIREVRPQVVITYDPNGGYGHPDISWRTGSRWRPWMRRRTAVARHA